MWVNNFIVMSLALMTFCGSSGAFAGNDALIIDPILDMEFVLVDGGCFMMGDVTGIGSADEKPVLKVCLAPFYMAKYETTQGQWREIMDSNPSYNKRGSNYPVDWVNWFDVQDFVELLNKKSSRNYRLPTEAEWEYAARDRGQDVVYSGGEDVETITWFRGNSSMHSHEIGTKKPNNLGLYDMSGNVWEWCIDWYHKNYQDGFMPPGETTSLRIARGGGWNDRASFLRAANRGGYSPGSRSNLLGFRLVLPITDKEK